MKHVPYIKLAIMLTREVQRNGHEAARLRGLADMHEHAESEASAMLDMMPKHVQREALEIVRGLDREALVRKAERDGFQIDEHGRWIRDPVLAVREPDDIDGDDECDDDCELCANDESYKPLRW